MSAEAFPLQWPEGWPRTRPDRRTPSRFGKNLGFNQIQKLQNELRLLGAEHVVISSNVPLRQDGLRLSTKNRQSMSIKQFIQKCFDEGMTAEEAWRAAHDKYYPLRIVGWNYVQKLARDYQRRM